MLFLGIVAAGGVFTGTNPSYTPHELSHHMRSSDTKFVITEPELLDNILAATKEVGLPRNNIFIFDTQSHQQVPLDFKSWRWLLRQGEKDWVKFDNLEEAQRTTAARLFSSGTTGLPKAAMITHHNFIAQHTLMYDINKPDYEVSCHLFSSHQHLFSYFSPSLSFVHVVVTKLPRSENFKLLQNSTWLQCQRFILRH